MEPKRPITPEDLITAPTISDPQVSPDGSHVAFVVGRASREGEHDKSAIYLVTVAGDAPARPFTAGTACDKAPRWSPDGQWLVFLSDRAEPGNAQPYRIATHGGEAERLVEIKGDVEDIQWSPDGRMLALRVVDGESDEEARRKKERDDAVVFGEHWKYAHTWALRLDDRSLTQVSTNGLHDVSLAWSPDSSRIAVLSLESPWADAAYGTGQITVHEATGGPAEQTSMVPGHCTDLRWSPDGATLAMRGPEGRVTCATAIFLLPVGSDRAFLLQPGYAGAVEWLNWAPDGRALLVGAVEDLTSTLLRVPLDQPGKPEVLLPPDLRGRGYFENAISFSVDGRTAAIVRSTAAEPPELWVGRDSAFRQRTAINAAVASWKLGQVELLRWSGADNQPISGLLIYPAEYEPGCRYPLILEIHGGPAWLWADRFLANWHDWAQYLASHGYAILLPNPRGSTGRGAAFSDANVDDYGGKEFEDSMCGVDALIKRGIADPARLGVGGWSHGGYMSAWAVTQTSRFKAAVMGAGLSNLLSDQGQNDIPHFNDVYFGARTFDDPDAYLRRSPITYVRRVSTPTLILHGGSDERVHPAQGREFYMALRLLGVPVSYVTYPREPHRIKERRHQADLLRRLLAWYDRYVKPESQGDMPVL